MKNYADSEGVISLGLRLLKESTLLDLHNSSYDAKAEFSNI